MGHKAAVYIAGDETGSLAHIHPFHRIIADGVSIGERNGCLKRGERKVHVTAVESQQLADLLPCNRLVRRKGELIHAVDKSVL